MVDANDVARGVSNTIVSAAGGFLAAVAVFRSRLAVMDAQRKADLEMIAQNRAHDNEMHKRDFIGLQDTLDRVERINRAVLEIVANIANASGATKRGIGTDVLAELLSTPHNDKAKG